MKILKLLLILFILSFGCKEQPEPKDQIETNKPTVTQNTDLFYHYSIWYAFVNKVFEGNLTVKELKTKGDLGLGSYTKLDGELVMLDGVTYQITEEGKVSIPPDDSKIVYSNSTFF
jgi:acetolactate decarboxylase